MKGLSAVALLLAFITTSLPLAVSEEEVCTANEDGTCQNTEVMETDEMAPSEPLDEDYEEDSEDEESEDYEDDGYDETAVEEDNYISLHVNLWGKPQVIEDALQEETSAIVEATDEYMRTVVVVDDDYVWVRFRCKNRKSLCSQWAAEGRCDTEHEYMVETCSPACKTCDELQEIGKPRNTEDVIDIEDTAETEEETEEEEAEEEAEEEGTEEESEEEAEAEGEFSEENDEDDEYDEPEEMEFGDFELIPWGERQNLGQEMPETVLEIMEETRVYMMETVYPSPDYEHVFEECENRHHDCSYWAALDYCDEYPRYMELNCAPACHTCEQLDVTVRCPVDPEAPQVFEDEGDLNAMFERIVTDPYWEENHGPVLVHSSPNTTGGPWLISLDKFATPEECNRFIDAGHELGYDISKDVGELNFDGSVKSIETEGRTSTNTWCTDKCHSDPTLMKVHERMESLTGVPYGNAEWFQLLRYEAGQFYEEHNDYISHEWDRPQGPRILTLYIYLNDVEEGGGTKFNKLDKMVMPKQGRAVLWPSVLDEDPFDIDPRTNHEAQPVLKGIKYGANAWMHLREYKSQFNKNCI